MAEVRTDEQNYINIANAIRAKNGLTDTYKPREMAKAIEDIQTSMCGEFKEPPFVGVMKYLYGTFEEVK